MCVNEKLNEWGEVDYRILKNLFVEYDYINIYISLYIIIGILV